MATVDDGELVFYPAFCFRASPTHFAWVKMGAVDVHLLKRRAGFEGMILFFLMKCFAGCLWCYCFDLDLCIYVFEGYISCGLEVVCLIHLGLY